MSDKAKALIAEVEIEALTTYGRRRAMMQELCDLAEKQAKALEFLVGGRSTWECEHGTPVSQFCSKSCKANVVRAALEGE